MKLKTITPTPGTPTALFVGELGESGKRSKIDGISVWLKGQSPCGGNYNRSPYYERAAYVVDEALELGLVPPTILHLCDGEVVSAMKWVCGERPDIPKPPLLRMFDYLISNCDRHGGNWLVKPSGRVWAIDNALSFNTHVNNFSNYADIKLPNKVRRNMRAITKHSKEFRKQLNCLLDKQQTIAVIKRMRQVLKCIK